MHRAMITFRTRTKSHGVRFPLVEYNPNMAGVEKIEIEGPNGFEIHATIHLPSVASVNEGREVAEKALWAALDRIIFHHDIAVENPLRKDDQAAVDALIKNQVPTVRETPQPPILRSRTRHKNPVMEMVYTKLRMNSAISGPV